jgi:prepilin signal peptidase PulO-like enzyme (type II secretory pathway)
MLEFIISSPMLTLAFGALIGLCVGSFIGMASWRIPRGEPIGLSRSHCPICLTTLRSWQLIPVFSQIFLASRCHTCKAPIAWRYATIELFSALLTVLVLQAYGLTALGLVVIVVAYLLLLISVVDLEHYIIPDAALISLLACSICYLWLQNSLHIDVLLRSLYLTLLVWLLRFVMTLYYQRPSLGLGDVKLLALIGLLLPIAQLPCLLVIAGSLGVVLAVGWQRYYAQSIFPFGPCLCIGLFLCLVYPDTLNCDRLYRIFIGFH